MDKFDTSLRKQARYIIKNFNFGKVCYYMSEVGWGWSNGIDAKWKIPDVEELKETATSLLNNLVVTSNTDCQCGGFRASKKDGRLKLKFISRIDKKVIEEKDVK